MTCYGDPARIQLRGSKQTHPSPSLSLKGFLLHTVGAAAEGQAFNFAHIWRLPGSSLETREAWMKLEGTILSQTEEKYCLVSLICGIFEKKSKS